MASNGDLVLTYREADNHSEGPSAIVIRVSRAQGRTWGRRIVIAQIADPVRDGRLNCSRIIRLRDGSLLLAVDWIPPQGGENSGVVWLYRSQDHGQSWEGPEDTSVRGGVVPALCQLRDGTLLAGLSRWGDKRQGSGGQDQLVFRSTSKPPGRMGRLICCYRH